MADYDSLKQYPMRTALIDLIDMIKDESSGQYDDLLSRIDAVSDDLSELAELLPSSEFSPLNTVKRNLDDLSESIRQFNITVENLNQDIGTLNESLPNTVFSSAYTVDNAINVVMGNVASLAQNLSNLNQTVQNVQTTANNAASNAQTAQNTANAAQTTANNALSTAQTADGKAVTAQGIANTANQNALAVGAALPDSVFNANNTVESQIEFLKKNIITVVTFMHTSDDGDTLLSEDSVIVDSEHVLGLYSPIYTTNILIHASDNNGMQRDFPLILDYVGTPYEFRDTFSINYIITTEPQLNKINIGTSIRFDLAPLIIYADAQLADIAPLFTAEYIYAIVNLKLVYGEIFNV